LEASVAGSDKITLGSGPSTVSLEKGGDAKLDGVKTTLTGSAEATLNGGGSTTVSAGGKVAIQGALVALN
jgi:hypothetical protein